MKYVELIGDGDSGCFGSVKEACYQKYGDDHVVVKEEGVGACATVGGVGYHVPCRKFWLNKIF